MAEEIVYGEIADGATSDLSFANRVARAMVTQLGMSRLGRVFYPEGGENPFLQGSGFGEPKNYSEQTAREIDMEVKKIIEDAVTEVRQMLKSLKPALDALAQRLIEKETIDGTEVRSIISAAKSGELAGRE